MALEGVVAIVAGIVAGSIALIGFGIDSAIIALAASSVVLMPLLGRAKQRIGARIGSSATASEGK
jgi:hypothetical protein